jgi:phosphoribosylaminoimidazole-succinocarboxamide synthase
MGTDLSFLREQCARTLESTNFPELGLRSEGKVRDSYIRGDRRTLIVSDRVSCFDVVVGTLPSKGQVLNQLAAFWFEKTREIAQNHLISVPDPCVSIVKECRPLPVEFIYRAYLTGSTSTSIWTAYEKGERSYCGHRLPEGLRRHEKLPQALLTPTTKAPKGQHDELISRAEIISRGLISEKLYAQIEKLTASLFAAGQAWAKSRGLILVDTKYEVALDEKDELIVIDEIHTPDSSRYWYADAYERCLSLGRDPEQLDKEYVRRWLKDHGYSGEGAIPEIPVDVKCEASRRYIEAFEQITARAFEPNLEAPLERIRRNLGLAR